MSDCFVNEFGDNVCTNTNWFYWGRWVLLGAVIAAIFGVYILFSCLSARRRHRAGVKPYTGTQWALGPNSPQYASTEALPTYTANATNTPNNANRDVESQRQPEPVHLPPQGADQKA